MSTFDGNFVDTQGRMEELFREIASHVALGLEVFSVLVIAVGAVEGASRIIFPFVRGRATPDSRRVAWLNLGRWLLLGLEFMLAADIVRTAISPDWRDIGQLAAIAVIRTFLSFFLERDLEKPAPLRGAQQLEDA
jgi:uncharacterized membrane protein